MRRAGEAVVLVFFLAVALVAQAWPTRLDRTDGPGPQRPGRRVVDVLAPPGPDEALERLVLEERYVEAFSQAVDEARSCVDRLGPEDLRSLVALRRVGVVAHLAGEQRLAGHVLDAILEALRPARTRPAADALAETLIWRGYAARYQGRRDLAARLYDEARDLLDSAPAASSALLGFLEQARADWTRGVDRSGSLVHYAAALRLRRGGADASWFAIADNEVWTAWTLLRVGRWEESRRHATEARRILQRIGVTDHVLLATLDELTAQDLGVHGRPREALAAYASAAAQAERSRQRHAPGLARSPLATEAFNALVVDAIERGEDAHAWELRQTGLGTVHASLSWLGGARERTPSAYVEMRAAEEDLLQATRSWEDGAPLPPQPWTRARADLLLHMLEARARVDELRMAYLEEQPLPRTTLQRVQELLDARTAMIGWVELHVGDMPTESTQPESSRGWAFVLRRDRPIRWIPLWNTRTREDWLGLTAFRLGMKRMVRAAEWPDHVASDPEMQAALAERGRRYFDPLRPYLEQVERLVVDGNLSLAVEIFVGPDGRYLSDEYEIVHVPSAVTFEVLTGPRHAISARPESILAVAAGTPVDRVPTLEEMIPQAADFGGKRALRSAFSRQDVNVQDLPPLPFAPVETASISQVFPRALHLEAETGNALRLRELVARGQLEQFDVVHLAGHALFDPSPERGAIVLGEDGLLTVEDVALSWRLKAQLVTFSACESVMAGGGTARGEPMGFTAASLGAGAPNVLSSLWPVDDRATAILMRRFYENLTGHRAPPMTVGRALSEAKAFVRELRDARGARPFHHPSYWAGWVLLGSGR